MPLQTDIDKTIRFLQDPKNQWSQLIRSIQAAGKAGNPDVLPDLEGFLQHPEALVRQAAQQAVTAIQEPPERAETSESAANAEVEGATHMLIIAGARGSGKTEFIRTIADKESLMISAEGTQVRLDLEDGGLQDSTRMTVNDTLSWYFVTTLGQRRLDSAWELRVKNCLGAVILVDGENLGTVHPTRLIIDEFKAHAGIPFVVAANKQDRPDPVSPEQMRRLLQLSSAFGIVPCVAIDYTSVSKVLTELLQAIRGKLS